MTGCCRILNKGKASKTGTIAKKECRERRSTVNEDRKKGSEVKEKKRTLKDCCWLERG